MMIAWRPELGVYHLRDGEYSQVISEADLAKYATIAPLFRDVKRQYELTGQGIQLGVNQKEVERWIRKMKQNGGVPAPQIGARCALCISRSGDT